MNPFKRPDGATHRKRSIPGMTSSSQRSSAERRRCACLSKLRGAPNEIISLANLNKLHEKELAPDRLSRPPCNAESNPKGGRPSREPRSPGDRARSAIPGLDYSENKRTETHLPDTETPGAERRLERIGLRGESHPRLVRGGGGREGATGDRGGGARSRGRRKSRRARRIHRTGRGKRKTFCSIL
jgi:hypothetical protein